VAAVLAALFLRLLSNQVGGGPPGGPSTSLDGSTPVASPEASAICEFFAEGGPESLITTPATIPAMAFPETPSAVSPETAAEAMAEAMAEPIDATNQFAEGVSGVARDDVLALAAAMAEFAAALDEAAMTDPGSADWTAINEELSVAMDQTLFGEHGPEAFYVKYGPPCGQPLPVVDCGPLDQATCDATWPEIADVERCLSCRAVTSYRWRVAIVKHASYGEVPVFARLRIPRNPRTPLPTVAASDELELDEGVVKRDLGRVLLVLEQLRDARLKKTLEPKKAEQVEIPRERKLAALTRLKTKGLIRWIDESLTLCGLVGERTNKVTAYLASVSRLLERPLAIIVQSSSAAGKSALMDAVLSLMPEEHRVKYSAMTGQALYYMGETVDLRHRILAIAEEEGASRATYALKLLQSEGEISIISTGKDPQSGELRSKEYKVKGPVMIFLTTTAVEIDEELLNRCLVLVVPPFISRCADPAAPRTPSRSRRTSGTTGGDTRV